MNHVAIDPERSARFGEQIPTSEERLRMRRNGVEHIDVNGNLVVPLPRSIDIAPPREGWEPCFVAVNLDGWPSGHQKWVTYRRPKA